MRRAYSHAPALLRDEERELEDRWQRALKFYQKRGHVIFINDSVRFWEAHGFVQQSLAKLLVKNGVKVTWLDGAGWRQHKAVISLKSHNLQVDQIFQLPGRRFDVIRNASDWWVAHNLNALIKKAGNPVVWVQDSLAENISEALHHIDIYSVFDDPYRHNPEEALCSKAKVITCQNTVAFERFHEPLPNKTMHLLPPMEISAHSFLGNTEFALPKHFPKKVMGYIGSFTADGYDFPLLEKFIKDLPDWGFMLVGRTDADGEKWVNRLKVHRNFAHFSWVPREKLAAAWKQLQVSLLFYREARINNGAFPVKVLEGLYFGVPSVATKVSKTSSLEGHIPRSFFADRLENLAIQMAAMTQEQKARLFRHFYYEMHPKRHLAAIAESLTK